MKQIESLNGLRGVAVLFVILSHLSNAGLDVVPFLSFSGIGKVGVWLFFVLSAFLLTLSLLNKSDSELLKTKTWKIYFKRRFLRIYPLLTCYLIMGYLLNGFDILPPLNAPSSLNDLASRYLLIDAKGIEWSVLVEFRFYFILPLIVIFSAVVLKRRLYFLSLSFFLALVNLVLYAPKPTFVDLLPYLSIFLIGSYVAYINWWLVHQGIELEVGLRKLIDLIAIFLFALIFVLTPSIWSKVIGKPVPLDYFHDTLVPFGILWSGVLLGDLWGNGVVSRFLSLRVLKYLGMISFSVYLLHLSVINLVLKYSTLNATFNAYLAIFMVILLSSLSYFCIERPFLKD